MHGPFSNIASRQPESLWYQHMKYMTCHVLFPRCAKETDTLVSHICRELLEPASSHKKMHADKRSK
jgi:hypothetical protein